MIIKKKCWPEYFNLIKQGKKKFEIRLADFKCKKGDVLVLEEYNPRIKNYTGRKIKKKIKNVLKMNLLKFYKVSNLKKGIYVIELK